jgi:ribosome modulation factor
MSAPTQQAERAVGAFNEGQQAYEDGYSDDVNPYQFGTALYTEWETGWDAAFELGYREYKSNEQDKWLDDPRHGQAAK